MALMRSFNSSLRCMANFRSAQTTNYCRFCTEIGKPNTQPIRQRRKPGNEIRLIGRVCNKVLSLQSGFDSFLLKTASNNNGNLISVMHSIKAKRNIVTTPNLSNNNLVYISGEIGYESLPSANKPVSIPHIIAKQIIQLENHGDPDDFVQMAKESVNEVKLLGHIGSDISEGSNIMFSMFTNSDLSTLLSTDHFQGNWHRIIVFDGHLKEFVKANLRHTDRLVVNGEIIYRKNEQVGANAGTILAKRIQKLQLTKQDTKNTQQTQQSEATADQ